MAFDPEITEDEDNYYIRIAAEDRGRAKRIPGRRWEPQLVKWVCPRTPAAYDAIRKEFVHPRDKVEITAPGGGVEVAKRAIEEPVASGDRDEPVEVPDPIVEELEGLNERLGESAGLLAGLMDGQRAILGKLTAQEQGRSEEEEIAAFSRYLMRVAAAGTKDDASFMELTRSFDIGVAPGDCVTLAHERVAESLREFTGRRGGSVAELIRIAEEQGHWSESGETWIPGVLRAVNRHRNDFGHPKMRRREDRVGLAALYFLELARVWSYFASDQVAD